MEKRTWHALQSTAGVPMSWLSWLNASAEMIAPALPHAADMPCAVARNLVGKTSAGYICGARQSAVCGGGGRGAYVGRGVRAEVEEELEEGEVDDERDGAERVELAREDGHCRARLAVWPR